MRRGKQDSVYIIVKRIAHHPGLRRRVVKRFRRGEAEVDLRVCCLEPVVVHFPVLQAACRLDYRDVQTALALLAPRQEQEAGA